MRKYTYEEKVKAVQLYIKYGRSPALLRHELGYPSKSCLNKWYNKYIKTGDLQKTGKDRNSKYTQEQRQAAIDYYLTHGKSVKRTILALGYPGKSTLCEWLNADVPDESRKWFCKKNSSIVRCSQEQKNKQLLTIVLEISLQSKFPKSMVSVHTQFMAGKTKCLART